MRLAAALFVLIPLTAHAQPADAALLDRVVGALRVGQQAETALASMQGRLGTSDRLFDPEAVADSVRARFRADLRPDLLRDALAHLQTPGYARQLDRSRALSQDPTALVRLSLGIDAPKKGSLADSALAARYLDAAGTVRQMTEILTRSMRAVVGTVPAAQADLDQRGQTADEAIAETVAQLNEQMAPLYLASARVVLAGVPPAEVEAAIAYYASPAGQYVTEAFTEGTLAAVLPGIVQWVTGMASAPPPSVPEESLAGPLPKPAGKP